MMPALLAPTFASLTLVWHVPTWAQTEEGTHTYTQVIVINENDDWLKLKSGEVLIGELIGTVKEDHNSYEQSIEFDSDDLGDQEVDIEDISVLQTSGTYVIKLANGDTLYGTLRIENDKLSVTSPEGTQQFPIEMMVSALTRANKEIDRWEADFFLGANLSKGNTNEASLSAEVNAKRQSVSSRTLLKYKGNVTQSGGEKTAQNHTADASYDIYLNNRLFFRPAKISASSDKFQNIDYRINASTQIGYFVLVTPELEWDVSVGPGYQITRYDTVLESESRDEESPILVFSSNFEWEVSKDVDFTHSYDLNWANNISGGIRHSNNIGVDFEIINDLDFSVKFTWDHVASPKTDSSGVTPDNNDYKLHFGLTYDF